MGTEPILRVEGLKKYFDTPLGKLHAVDGVNFSIKAGETLGVVGESGCGKTTLGRTILRLSEPTEGEIFFQGENICNYSKDQMKHLRKNMQIIFQDPYASLNPRLSVGGIIAEPLIVNKMYRSKSEMNTQIEHLMETVGLSPRLINAYPHELDGGRRQRIGIARALATDPSFIVCDEPVSALDVSIQAQILNLMMDLQEEKGLSYLFITHDLSVVKHISTHIAVMYLGQCVELATKEELFENPLHPYTKALLAAIPAIDISKRGVMPDLLTGEIKSPINVPVGCRFCTRCKHAVAECEHIPYELKEVTTGHFVACHRI